LLPRCQPILDGVRDAGEPQPVQVHGTRCPVWPRIARDERRSACRLATQTRPVAGATLLAANAEPDGGLREKARLTSVRQ
jgi:hypothetical protein